MADYPEVVYWLTLIQQSGLKLNLVKPIIQRWCIAEQRPLSKLFALSPLEWSANFGLGDAEAEQASTAADKLDQQARLLAEWQGQGVELIIRVDPRYPRRFIHTLAPAQQPLLLWASGASELLNESQIALLGSDPPDTATQEFLDLLMQAVVAEDIGLVSGYGRGLDRTTFEMMLNTEDGQAVVILPMGISAFTKTTARLEEALAAKKITLVSPFPPETAYQDRFAEARNLLIDHLALALLVLQTDSDSEARAGAALNRGLPVFVSLNDTAGNRALIDQGALLLTDAGEVIEMVQQAVIDATLLASEEGEDIQPGGLPAQQTPPAAELTDPNDDYNLRLEEIEPIDSEEALEILSLGGEIPELLRQRLQKAAKDKGEESRKLE